MEVEFLGNIQYNLFASEDEWIKWHAKLKRFSAFYHEALLVPRVNEQLVSNNPTIHISTRLGPKLPSPPLYPAYKLPIFPNWSLPVGGATYTPVLPQLGNKMPLLLNTRKRSCGEPPMEHPVKKSRNIPHITALSPSSALPSIPMLLLALTPTPAAPTCMHRKHSVHCRIPTFNFPTAT